MTQCINQLLEMVDEGLLDPAPLLAHCLGWMGEGDVRAMCAAHGIEWQASGEEEPDEEEGELADDGASTGQPSRPKGD